MRLDVDKEVIILSRDHAKTDESVGEFRRFRSKGGNAAKCLSGNEAETAYAEYNGKRGEEELRGPTRDRRTPPNASPKSAGGAREKTFSGAIPSRQISPRESLQDRFHRRCRGPFPHRRCGFKAQAPAFRPPHGRADDASILFCLWIGSLRSKGLLRKTNRVFSISLYPATGRGRSTKGHEPSPSMGKTEASGRHSRVLFLSRRNYKQTLHYKAKRRRYRYNN